MICPHCAIGVSPKFTEQNIEYDKSDLWSINSMTCPECKRLILILFGRGKRKITTKNKGLVEMDGIFENRYILPKSINRDPIPKEVDNKYKNDFEEACLVLSDSPKASAALSRRSLQAILVDKGKASLEKNLYQQIQEVIDSKDLPSRLARNLHAVREIGNFAAHERKSTHSGEIIDVEPEEAEWNLEVIEGLFDHYFVLPAKDQERLDKLNKKLTDAGKKPIK